MNDSSCILFCNCGANVISGEMKDQLAKVFKHFETDVFELHDLCALSVQEKDVLITIAEKYDRKLIVACYPRAIQNIFRQVGVDFREFEVLNFKEFSALQIEEKLATQFQMKKGVARWQVQKSELDVPAWFPVIDQEKCTLCGKCARFCLFGVYSFDKKSLKVVDPLACKNNCPACGRTCPTSAIMFPRLHEKTVLAGAEPAKEGLATRGKDSLFVLLNERNQNRKNIFKQGVVQLAEEERRKALEELKNSTRKKK